MNLYYKKKEKPKKIAVYCQTCNKQLTESEAILSSQFTIGFFCTKHIKR